MDKQALNFISYGLFVLTAQQDGFDNGCIVNTVAQVTDEPLCITVTVNKKNLTHDMIAATGRMNISILDKSVPFDIFKQFGFVSGREGDKFGSLPERRTANGLRYLPAYTSAVLSAQVTRTVDMGTHTLFVALVTDTQVMSGAPAVTYADYHANIKPKPAAAPAKKGWRCKICGYVYEGETLPPDFVCPLCKHGAADFEPV